MDALSRINVRTSDENDTWLFHMEKLSNRAGLKFRGKKLTKEGLVNALVASASKEDEAIVLKRILDGLSIYESQLVKMASIPAIKR